MNVFQVVGNVLSTRLSANGVFSVILRVRTPKHASNQNSDDAKSMFNVDLPLFVFDQDKKLAEEWYNQIQKGDRIAICGYAETKPSLVYEGNRRYHEEWTTIFHISQILFRAGYLDNATAMLSGKITRLYKSENTARKFYSITLETNVTSEKKCLVNIVYFDSELSTEMKVGDFVMVNGDIQCKRFRVNDESEERPRYSNRVSIVSRLVAFQPSQHTEE